MSTECPRVPAQLLREPDATIRFCLIHKCEIFSYALKGSGGLLSVQKRRMVDVRFGQT
jgi:hypothetical protein